MQNNKLKNRDLSLFNDEDPIHEHGKTIQEC